ncbi:hypothetical protein [Jatrophihabitans lederbergiae]|uniref:ImmA/IrrE family metallo-endopeptidase n=1 Tax=Jatrophihabitans lederbergiae TaxID=3075547 RepID=A0ABU2JFA1_9ACTN|nr:hypothetical protein [Jatrophihabitans sp. DSM 44399]MDT0263602.1 hypothetical protein [Jatrophihabitans sp. DSM 44399]
MTVTTSGCSIGADALAAIKAGLEAANVDADVVVAGNFVATIRQLTGSCTYHVDRGAGVVGAKTVNAPGGPTIVFNYDIASQTPAPELERLAAHEAGHVLLYGRAEHVSDYQHLVTNEADWHLLCVASFAAEEFRIESALPAFGYQPWTADPAQHTVDALAELNYQVISSVLGEPTVEQMRDKVLAAQDVFSKVLAYSAGAHVSGGPMNVQSLAGDAAAEWNDLVGESWENRLKLWRSLPDAWHATAEGQWPGTLVAGLALERQFLERLGFHYELTDEGLLFARTGSDELFNQRLERAQRDFPE